jgi:DNA-binding Xre family transcriptional regulator
MTLDDIIIITENRLNFLNNQIELFIKQGDINKVTSLQQEKEITNQTLEKLKTIKQ